MKRTLPINTTYYINAKADPKDRIDVEVGDSKQVDFYPQMKIKRWDNEVNVSLRLINTEKVPKLSVTRDTKNRDRVKWEGSDLTADIYALDYGHEFEVTLLRKPKTNKMLFSLQTKGVVFNYQAPLTVEEIARGAFRPDNVVGSYAICQAIPSINWKGGKIYGTGKIGHIYRPSITDSVGQQVWGDLHIDSTTGILTVTIPQEFLDKAVYPVYHASGLEFGYNTLGASHNGGAGGYALFTIPGYAGGDGDGVSISWGVSGTGSFKSALYTFTSPDYLVVTNGLADVGTISGAPDGWVTVNFPTAPTLVSGTTYFIIIDNSASSVYELWDSGRTGSYCKHRSMSYASFPVSFSSPYNDYSNAEYSAYVTYTAGGPVTSFLNTNYWWEAY